MIKRCWHKELCKYAGVELCVVDDPDYSDCECDLLVNLHSCGLSHIDCEFYKDGKGVADDTFNTVWEGVCQKFTSGNSIEVTRAILTREEFLCIKEFIERGY